MEQLTEEKLIQQARRGDQDAICQLYENTKNYAWFIASRYLKNSEDIADALQETYISAFSKLYTFEDGKSFKTWIHTIVVNKCLDFLKKKKVMQISTGELAELVNEDEDIIPALWIERAEKRRDIIRIIDALPEGQRMAVTLFYIEGLPVSEIAAIMSVAEGSVKTHLSRGRKAIKEAVLLEEKKGNKLYGIVAVPLLTQLFEMEAEAAVMPEEMSKIVWEGIQNGLATAGGSGTGQQGGSGSYGQNVHNSGTGGASGTQSGAANIGKTATEILIKKVIIGLVAVAGAAAVITAGVVLLPMLTGSSDNSSPPGVTDNTAGQTNTEKPDTTPSQGDPTLADLLANGTYEGEVDANGKRSGYGVWIYDNFRYEGYFENDMPNGEGVLYEGIKRPKNTKSDGGFVIKNVVSGPWSNGFSNGTITLSQHLEDGTVFTYTLKTQDGYPTQDGEAYTTYWLIGVPPWAGVTTDPSAAPPSGTASTQPTDEMPEGKDMAGFIKWMLIDGTYSYDYIMLSDGPDGKTETSGSMAVSDDKVNGVKFSMYGEIAVDGGFYQVHIIHKDGKSYMLRDRDKQFAEIDLLTDMLPESDDTKKTGEGTGEINGKMLPYEDYGATRFYLEGGDVYGYEINVEGYKTVYIISNASGSVPEGVFDIPADYAQVNN